MIPKMFTFSHKSNDDFVFCSNGSKLVFNPCNNNICYCNGKQFIYYQAKRKDGMLELMVQYSMLEPGFEDIPDPFAFVMLKGTPSTLTFNMIE